MSVDRRDHDPYAPKPRLAAVDPLVSVTASTPPTPAPAREINTDEMSKLELIEIAYRLKLPTYGTKADLITRISEAKK